MDVADSLSILIVDEDATFLERMSRALRDRGHHVVTEVSYEDALYASLNHPITCAILDVRMPRRSELALARDLRALHPRIQIVLLSASSADDARDSSDPETVHLRKPVDADEVLIAFSRTKHRNE